MSQVWGEQNAGDRPINPRNGVNGYSRNAYPRGVPVYAPAMLPMGTENPGSTLPSDGFSAHPNIVIVDVSFGDHDALGGRLMAVSQGDTYDASACPWPAAGVYDQPGAQVGILPLVRLQPTTSAHPGLASATGAGPAMLYRAPPSFSAQSVPIPALGV
jgi:hypothetical protein